MLPSPKSAICQGSDTRLYLLATCPPSASGFTWLLPGDTGQEPRYSGIQTVRRYA